MTQWERPKGLRSLSLMGEVCFPDRVPLTVTFPPSWPKGASTASGLYVPSSLIFSAVWGPGVSVLPLPYFL